MDMKIDHFASELLTYLTPIMPYLIKWAKIAGVESAKGIGSEIGKKIPDAVKRLWNKIWGKAEEDHVFKNLLETYSNDPQQEAIQAILLTKLKNEIDNDKKFRIELEELVRTAQITQPNLSMLIEIETLSGEAISLQVNDGNELANTNIREANIEEKVKRISKGGKLIGAQFGSKDDNE